MKQLICHNCGPKPVELFQPKDVKMEMAGAMTIYCRKCRNDQRNDKRGGSRSVTWRKTNPTFFMR